MNGVIPSLPQYAFLACCSEINTRTTLSFHNEELHGLYVSPGEVRRVKCRNVIIRWILGNKMRGWDVD
jgi:hypothetical protein